MNISESENCFEQPRPKASLASVIPDSILGKLRDRRKVTLYQRWGYAPTIDPIEELPVEWQQGAKDYCETHQYNIGTHKLLMLLGPIVYIFRDKEGTAKYIGSSINGIRRPFEKGHRHKELLESGDVSLEIYPFVIAADDEDERDRRLVNLEKFMMLLERPTENISNNRPNTVPYGF